MKRENDELKNIKIPKYWGVVVNKWNPHGSLRTMDKVFSNLGYKIVNASNGDDWDFLWSIGKILFQNLSALFILKQILLIS
jgi:hypothetical protein